MFDGKDDNAQAEWTGITGQKNQKRDQMIRFSLKVENTAIQVAEIVGSRSIPFNEITSEDTEKIPEVEKFLERLFGLRFHINIHS